MSTVVVRAAGPHIRIKGTGNVRVLTSQSIVKVPVAKETDVKFTNQTKSAEDSHAA